MIGNAKIKWHKSQRLMFAIDLFALMVKIAIILLTCNASRVPIASEKIKVDSPYGIIIIIKNYCRCEMFVLSISCCSPFFFFILLCLLFGEKCFENWKSKINYIRLVFIHTMQCTMPMFWPSQICEANIESARFDSSLFEFVFEIEPKIRKREQKWMFMGETERKKPKFNSNKKKMR